jgi:hypothetical protein
LRVSAELARSETSLHVMSHANVAAAADDSLWSLADWLSWARASRRQFHAATPFPHLVVDNLFAPESLDAVLAEFPAGAHAHWRQFDDGSGRKRSLQRDDAMGGATRGFLRDLNSPRFLTVLEALTGIEGLIPDPGFEGGGLHEIERGGFLKIHADFNRHPRLGLDRRLNLLIYLNKDWREEYGGHLELWPADMSSCARRVLPVFNRCVVFSTTDASFHGHPEELACLPGMSRKSIALYYYSRGRPPREVSRGHGTLYQRRPGEGIFSPLKLARTMWHRLIGKRAG